MLDICETVLVDVQALIRIGFLKASSDEAPYIDVEEAKKECCLVVTNGKDGCTIYYRNLEQVIAPFPIVQVDPTGAGDSFLSGLVVGLAQGLAVPDAALLGNFFGSFKVGQVGLPKFDLRVLQENKNQCLFRESRFPMFETWSQLIEVYQPGEVLFTPLGSSSDASTVVKEGSLDAEAVDVCEAQFPVNPKQPPIPS